MGTLHTPGCEITWTQVRFAEMRDVVRQSRPLQIMFGVHVAPSVWERSNSVYIEFLLLQRDTYAWGDTRSLDTQKLPGRPSPDIWLARGFSQASQVVSGGWYVFRPYIWFLQSSVTGGYMPGEFAVGEDHHFVVELGGAKGEFAPPEFTGGAGTPG